MKFGRKHWFTNPMWNLSLGNTKHNNNCGRKNAEAHKSLQEFSALINDSQKKRKQKKYKLLRILSSKWDSFVDLVNLEYPEAERTCGDTLHSTGISALSNRNNILLKYYCPSQQSSVLKLVANYQPPHTPAPKKQLPNEMFSKWLPSTNILTRKSSARRMKGPDKCRMTAVHETPLLCSDSQSILLK